MLPPRARLPVALLALVLGGRTTPARSDLPAGWTVHTFTGRIREIAAAGDSLVCATEGGLLFFDRVSSSFAPPVADAGCTDGHCLTSNHLTSVSRDDAAALWLGTETAGVVAFRPDDPDPARRYRRYFTLNTQPGGDLLGDSVSCVEAYRAEAVYVGTTRGVAEIDIDLASGIDSHNPEAARRLGSDVRGSRIFDLAAGSQYVWVATDSGMSRYDRQPPYTVEIVSNGLPGPAVYTVEILGGEVYAGTPTGVHVWSETGRAWSRIGGPTPTFPAYSVARLSDGRLWAGSATDMWMWTGFIWGQLSPGSLFLLRDRRFDTVLATGDTVWTCQVNDERKGGHLEAWYPEPPPAGFWQRFVADGPPPSEVRTVALAPTGDLWIGTLLGGVARLGASGRWCGLDGNDATVRANMTNYEGYVSAMVAVRGTPAGSGDRVLFTALPNTDLSGTVDILRADPGCNHAADGWDHIGPGELGFAGRYWRAVVDDASNIYFLADGEPGDPLQEPRGGIDVLTADFTESANLRPTEIPAGLSVGALAFDLSRRPWQRAYVGVNGQGSEGLKLWTRSDLSFPPTPLPNPNYFQTQVLPDSIDVAQFRDIVVTPSDPSLLWVGTASSVFQYDANDQRITLLLETKRSSSPGLLSGDVKDLQFDDAGNLWVACTDGLNRIRLAELAQGRPLTVDAFATIEKIRELNAASTYGQLYDPRKTLAPLPGPKVNALDYDSQGDVLYLGTDGGVATIAVGVLDQTVVVPVDRVVLYPNPVRIQSGHNQVKISNLSGPATVTIYTLEGEIVCETQVERDDDVVWDLTTPSCLTGEGNYRAASGIYPVRISNASGSTIRTVVVIR